MQMRPYRALQEQKYGTRQMKDILGFIRATFKEGTEKIRGNGAFYTMATKSGTLTGCIHGWEYIWPSAVN